MAKLKPQDSARTGKDQNKQVVDLLNVLGGRLIDSEKERVAIKEAISTLHNRLDDLDSKADHSEIAYLTFQSKINQAEQTEQEVRALLDQQKSFMDKIEKTARLAEQIEETLTQQKRINRRLDKVAQDRSRLDRKLDRIEESVIQAQDVINAKALVLLADKQIVAQSGVDSVPVTTANDDAADKDITPWWKPASFGQSAAIVAVFALAMWTGWALNEKPFEGAQNVAQSFFSRSVDFASNATKNKNTETAATQSAYNNADIYGDPESYADAGYDNTGYDEDSIETAAMDTTAAQLNDIIPSSGNINGDASANTAQNTNLIPVSLGTSSNPINQSAQAAPFNLEQFLADNKPAKPLGETLKPDPHLASALRETEERAFEGNHKAQHDLGIIYAAGHGDVPVDYQRALIYFRYASYGDIPNARYNLGVLYHQGLGTDQNLAAALGWYHAAADLGHPDAMYNLGIANIEGIGTSYQPQKAALYFRDAANNGVMEAAYNLGLIHENGLLGAPDTDEALYWYKVAADKNSSEARAALNDLSKRLGKTEKEIEAIYKEKTQKMTGQKKAASDKANTYKEQHASALTDADIIGTPSAEQKKLEITQKIQGQLIERGLYPGPATGYSNPQTEDAILSYQAIHELPRTGQASEDLLLHMASTSEEYGSRE